MLAPSGRGAPLIEAPVIVVGDVRRIGAFHEQAPDGATLIMGRLYTCWLLLLFFVIRCETMAVLLVILLLGPIADMLAAVSASRILPTDSLDVLVDVLPVVLVVVQALGVVWVLTTSPVESRVDLVPVHFGQLALGDFTFIASLTYRPDDLTNYVGYTA